MFVFFVQFISTTNKKTLGRPQSRPHPCPFYKKQSSNHAFPLLDLHSCTAGFIQPYNSVKTLLFEQFNILPKIEFHCSYIIFITTDYMTLCQQAQTILNFPKYNTTDQPNALFLHCFWKTMKHLQHIKLLHNYEYLYCLLWTSSH